ncbi:glycosyltransferase family 2 protein [Algoriphagus aestuariicola]|uniref:Glycosyltransferase family 2 protein n=1 Tax=Algoriphagus aestuariicola TaxID=1852016 RepID=A0ABS3BRZ6_9BACT|nr:glycosyltransferase family 2 protein [Algoriphagus aestuariicola]MBN7801120.1 glycosyltransferase family 2 protein [Algoriphagus aestuariicola]
MLSVIIPSYKPQDYIYRCLDSVWGQTIDRSKYEVTIILNGEKEPFFTSINEYISLFDNFKCVYSPVRGVSAARNFGLDRTVDSEFIVFIDDDDYVSPNYLEILYNTIVVTESEIVQSNFKNDVCGAVHDDYISRAFDELHGKLFDIVSFRKFFSSVCGKVYNRKFIGKFRFNENVTIAEDAIFLFTLSRNLTRFELSSMNCIYYRCVREGSTVRSYRSFYKIFNNYFVKIYIFSLIFFRNPIEYSFIFYLTRLLAITKTLAGELKTALTYRK